MLCKFHWKTCKLKKYYENKPRNNYDYILLISPQAPIASGENEVFENIVRNSVSKSECTSAINMFFWSFLDIFC